MNCTNCGREIPEGENKLCEECQSKLLEELSKEDVTESNDSKGEKKKNKKGKKNKKEKASKKDEQKEEIKTETTEDSENKEESKSEVAEDVESKEESETESIDDTKNKEESKLEVTEDAENKEEPKEESTENTENKESVEKSESKEEKKKDEENKTSKFKISKENSSDKRNIIIAATIIMMLIVVGTILLLSMLKTNNIGNTIGNVRNYGYSTTDGKWIYYLSPSQDTEKVGICKVKINGEDKQELMMDSIDILSINVYKNYIYFIGIGINAYSDTDEIDNKIYRMKTDGSDLEVINDNEFNNECYEIYVLNNSIYYIGTDENIYKMKLDGTKRELVSDNGTGYIGITDKYIIYNVENEAGDDYVTYIMNIDGTNQRPVLENKRLYSVDISGNYVYYTNTDKQIYRTEIDSGEEQLVLDDTAYNLNLNGDYLYFLNYLDIENEDYTVALFRVKADGTETEAQNIKTLSSYSTFINVINDWVMYMDNDSTSGFINLVNKNATGEEKKIYVLDYASYYESVENVETPEVDKNNADGQENVSQPETAENTAQ